MFICFWFWSWKRLCRSVWILKAPFILKCFEQRWHWNFFISTILLDWALSISSSLLGVKLCTKLKCKFSKCSSTNTKPQISQRNFSSDVFIGDEIFTIFVRFCLALGSFLGLAGGGGASSTFSSEGRECPKRWIVSLSKPSRISLHKGHLIGLLFTLIRFSLNVSMLGKLERQHNGHDNSEHILHLISSSTFNRSTCEWIKFNFGGQLSLHDENKMKNFLWKLRKIVCSLYSWEMNALKIDRKEKEKAFIASTESDHFLSRERCETRRKERLLGKQREKLIFMSIEKKPRFSAL